MRDCIICHSASESHFYCTVDNQDYSICNRCGLVYVDKLLSPDKLYRAYTGNFLKSFRRKIVSPFRKFHQYRNFEEAILRARKIIEFTAKQLVQPGEHQQYLDIGCNRGYLLSIAHELNWNPHGVELVPELMAPFLNTYPQFRNQVYSERFEDVRKKYFSENYFDIITGIDVIEHFEDVVADLSGIFTILKPGGVAVFQTPDAGCTRAKQEKCRWGIKTT